MNDEFYRPTYTSGDEYGAFNATQVRLYGIPGQSNEAKNTFAQMLSSTGKSGFVIAGLNNKKDAYKDRNTAALTELQKAFGNENVKAVLGKKLTDAKYAHVFVDAIMKGYLIMVSALHTVTEGGEEPKPLTSGIIFGYAYEGHTYQLPKPKIMLIPADPQTIPDDDSGYEDKASAGYRVWLVDKLDQCVEVEVSQGFIEQLVLDANLPGKRSPSMYAGRMMLAHRSGKMME